MMMKNGRKVSKRQFTFLLRLLWFYQSSDILEFSLITDSQSLFCNTSIFNQHNFESFVNNLGLIFNQNKDKNHFRYVLRTITRFLIHLHQ